MKSEVTSCDTHKKMCTRCLKRTAGITQGMESRCNGHHINTKDDPGINTSRKEDERKLLNSQCCSIPCYNTPACLTYYGPICQSQVNRTITLEEKVCMDGNTFHVSIMPEFDFQNGTFMCHLKKINYSLGFRIKFSIVLLQLAKQEHFHEQRNPPNEFSIESEHRIQNSKKFELNVDAVKVRIPVKRTDKEIPHVLEDIILLGHKNQTNQGYDFFMHQLPISNETHVFKPSVERALHTDSSFTTLQSKEPHGFSSVNWKRKGCDLDIHKSILLTKQSFDFLRKGQSVDIYAISNAKINLTNPVSSQVDSVYLNKPHRFRLNHKQISLPKVNIRLSGNQSVLRPVFCSEQNAFAKYNLLTSEEHKSIGRNRIIRRAVKAFVKFTTNAVGQQILQIFVTGHVTGTPAYLNLKIVWTTGYLVISNHDVIVLSSHKSNKNYLKSSSKLEQFQLSYEIDLQSVKEIPYDKLLLPLSSQSTLIFDVIVQDCHTNVTIRIYNLLTENKMDSEMSNDNDIQTPIVGIHLNRNTTVESTEWTMYSPLLFITIGIGLLYFLVLIIFVCIKHFIISNKGYPISVGYQKFVNNNNNQCGSELQYHQLLLHPFPVKINNHTLYYATSRKGEDYIQAFPPGRHMLYHPTIVAKHSNLHVNESQNTYRKLSSNPSWLHQNAWNTNSSKLKRIFLFTHLAFRVFYTFLFTFSVAVSLIFSLQPSGRSSVFDNMLYLPKLNRESLAFSQMERNSRRSSAATTSVSTLPLDQIHLIGPILKLQNEARWIEEFTEQELKRQLDYVERMKLACQHAMTVELTDALREGRHLVKTRLENWQINSTVQNDGRFGDNTLQSIYELVNHHFSKQGGLFDHIYEQISQQLDFRKMKSYKIYSNMLNSVFHSGWLQYTKRMLNTSDNLERTPRHFADDKVHSATKLNFHDSMRRYFEIAQQKSGIKASYIALMNYMNFYQAESVHMLPLQLLESLKKIFASPNHYRSMFHLSSDVSKSIKESQTKFQTTQVINSKNLPLRKMRQERIFLTTNDLEEYVDNTINLVEEILTKHYSDKDSKLISENFIEYIKRNAMRNGEDQIIYSKKHSLIPVMTLTHIRLSLLILDCLIIVYRFFHTYEILKAIWTGQKLFVDASSWLERQMNTITDKEKENQYFQEGNKLTAHFNKHSNSPFNDRKNCVHSDHVSCNETVNKRFSRIGLFQCIPQQENRYECKHDGQALYQSPPTHSSVIPRKSQTSETTPSVLPNKIAETVGPKSSKENIQPCCTYSQLPQISCGTLRCSSLVSIGPPLSLPPSSLFGIEQNTGCMLGVRTACCRKSHYISSVVGLTVLILLLGLVMMQVYKSPAVLLKKSSTSTSTHTKQHLIQFTGNKLPHLSTQINIFRSYHELIIRDHSKRLNQDWLGWTRRNEMATRGRVLNYLSRFKYELGFFDQQMESENSVIQSLLSRIESSTISKSDRNYEKPVKYPASPVFNSEFLFRQQICHFLPVIPVPIYNQVTTMNGEDLPSAIHETMRPRSIKQIIWTATISTFVDFDWNSQAQANKLFITAIIVGVVMITCIGVVDLGGKILKMLYINPAVSLSDIQKWRSNQKKTNNENELKSYDQNVDNIILISPQPAPIIPWPSKLVFSGNGKLITTIPDTKLMYKKTSSPESSTSILKEPEAQLPLTAFYLDTNLVFTHTSTPSVCNNKSIQHNEVTHSIPVLIAHPTASTPIIALKTDPLASINQLSGVLYENT
ncbi:unnamed protein product [Heterobilharzia americana]|nr:unnamed protein product [Heterobilharzia americana]